MRRIAAFTYGVICYAIFFVTFCYAAGFVGNIVVPKSIDSAPQGPFWLALLIDVGLLTLFALQHSVMARPAFKRVWTKIVPKPIERSTFVLFASLALIALFAFWRPLGGTIWHVEDTVGQAILYGMFAAGWLLVLASTFMIDHFDLFGLRQVWLYLRGSPYEPPKFRTPLLYKYIRHPLYLGFMIGFWATPTMTAAHLLFAIMTTGYMLVALRLEERDLVAYHGRAYVEYAERVPRFIPQPTGERAGSEQPAGAS